MKPKPKPLRERVTRASFEAIARLLRAIVEQLDGRDWSPDTLDAIADLLRNAGYVIHDRK